MDIIPVIVGGLLAVAGGLSSQLVIHWLSVRRDKSKLKRERIEQFVESVFDHSEWVLERHQTMVFRAERYDYPDPLNKAKMLRSLYFPSLSKELAAVQQETVKLTKITNALHMKHLADPKSFIQNFEGESFLTSFEALRGKEEELASKARKILEKN